MSSWGLNCTILRQTGLVNLTRSELNLEWTVDTSFFDSKKQQVRNLMSDWQVALGWSAPGASSPGIAPAMAFNLETPEGASSTDLDYFARNFLEASAALEKTVYEVAAGNSTRAKNATVQGTMKIQLYRITFIPAIAFASILTICIAASLTAGLAWYSEISLRTPRGRIIDGLRLTSDLLLAFQGQQYDLPKSHSDSDTVEKRGKGFRVYYKPWTEGTQASIRLDQV
ncbi:hypothetical protein M438DRAFT_347318 [Aureobasidium pullulans EXF-150]|uniref:Uncharacterized protein n=1 Tax=Aureobasidium pullulans EXF-150 TaxID=1043002 RepID=A0A074XFS9_AURPU|nr:uncharacterized protein M438DRAFT_347318 [Aureobasidium pullulans EXF-150]KEQ82569.1 hypothetical protein M438DRAFT_347318 [Aureobasidium pullulans EXF-150]